ncbi:hypothetical protein F5141DRAFT_1067111 [Pisolithus sp. B1]|nr:hypothetical protein F5141DRAFT_1067111 [Pisolithus sp. B1]
MYILTNDRGAVVLKHARPCDRYPARCSISLTTASSRLCSDSYEGDESGVRNEFCVVPASVLLACISAIVARHSTAHAARLIADVTDAGCLRTTFHAFRVFPDLPQRQPTLPRSSLSRERLGLTQFCLTPLYFIRLGSITYLRTYIMSQSRNAGCRVEPVAESLSSNQLISKLNPRRFKACSLGIVLPTAYDNDFISLRRPWNRASLYACSKFKRRAALTALAPVSAGWLSMQVHNRFRVRVEVLRKENLTLSGTSHEIAPIPNEPAHSTGATSIVYCKFATILENNTTVLSNVSLLKGAKEQSSTVYDGDIDPRVAASSMAATFTFLASFPLSDTEETEESPFEPIVPSPSIPKVFGITSTAFAFAYAHAVTQRARISAAHSAQSLLSTTIHCYPLPTPFLSSLAGIPRQWNEHTLLVLPAFTRALTKHHLISQDTE